MTAAKFLAREVFFRYTESKEIHPSFQGEFDRDVFMDIIPTGSLALNLALGTGGIPRGDIIEIYGPPSSGKTTLALHLIAQAQQQGLRCLFLDMENGLNPSYAVRCGVKDQEMLLARPFAGDDALEVCYTLLSERDIDLIVIDSIAALAAREELLSTQQTPQPGALNRLLSRYLRKLQQACLEHQATLFCTNQLRSRLRVGYGTPETTPGGLTLKLYAGIRIELKIVEYLQEDGCPQGIKIKVTINKSRYSSTKHSTMIEIVYNIGIVRERELFSLGRSQKLITRQKSAYRFRDYNLGRDEQAAHRLLIEKPEIANALEQAIQRCFRSNPNAILSL